MNALRHIVIADDDIDDVSLFLDAMEEIDAALQVSSAMNGEILLEKIRNMESLPDLLFLDLNMPIKNGLETLETFAAFPELRPNKIVVLSTSSNDLYVSQAFEKGVCCYLQKPGSFESLKKMIRYCLYELQCNVNEPKGPLTELDF